MSATRTRKQRALSTALVVLPILALIGLAMTNRQPNSKDAKPKQTLSVRAKPLRMVDHYVVKRDYTGELRARQSSLLGFEAGGRVLELLVDVGDSVKAGDVLGKLDETKSTARRDQVAARLAQAKARLAEMQAGPRQETILAARANTKRLQSELKLADIQLRRKQQMMKDKVSSEDEVDVAESRQLSLRAQLAQAKAELQELLNGTRKEQIDAQKALVRELQASLRQMQQELRDCVLRASFDGRVADRMVDEGIVLQAGEPVLRVLDSHHLEAWVGLPPDSAARLDLAKTYTMRVRSTIIELKPSRLLPQLDPVTRTVTAVFDISQARSARLHAGDMVRLQIPERVPAKGFWLPISALSESVRGLWSCYLLQPIDGKPEFRVARAEVESLHVAGDRVLVRGTLRSGDLIVVAGTQRVVPGQEVRRAADGDN